VLGSSFLFGRIFATQTGTHFAGKCSNIVGMKTARFRTFYRLDRLAAVLAMAAVLMRCVIAPGLMLDPMAAAQGKLKLVICTSAGTKSIVAASDQGSVPDQRGDRELCPYAAPGHAGTLADPVALGDERIRPAFEASTRNAAHRSPNIHGFAARAPPLT
jgi:hypothetical protein